MLTILAILSRRTCQLMQYFQPSRHFRSCHVNQPGRSTPPAQASRSTQRRKRSIPSQSTMSRPRRTTPHPLVGLADQVAQIILVILVFVSPYSAYGYSDSIYPIHHFQDFCHNQAMRLVPPGRVGYPSQPAHSNRYSRPIPPKHTARTLKHGETSRQMADDRIRHGR